ncbi:MAG: hypothetical protein V1915_02270 [Candidatus Bathyarchaeota archaeon]
MTKHTERLSFDEAYATLYKDFSSLERHRVSDKIRDILVRAYTKLPKKIVKWAQENVIFISSVKTPLACCVHKNMESWKGYKGFIFISDSVLNEPEETQNLAIAHEIAYIKKEHKSCSNDPDEDNEADALARKWLSEG